MSEKHLAKGDELPPVDPERLRLYSMRYCPFVQRAKLVLEHRQVPHETVFVNLKNKPDWLFERNPFGLVPVIEHKGNVMFESGICMEFIEDAYPESANGIRSLWPSDPFKKAAMRVWMAKFDKLTPSAAGLIYADNSEKVAEHINNLHAKLPEFEQHLTSTNEPFFAGKEYGMVDLHGYPWFERFAAIGKFRSLDLLPIDKFPRLNAWISSMQGLDIVKKIWLSTNQHHKFIETHTAGAPTYDMDLDQETKAVQASVGA